MTSNDRKYSLLTATNSVCVIEKGLHANISQFSDCPQIFRNLRDRVIVEVAHSALCTQLGHPSTEHRLAIYISSRNAAECCGEPARIGIAFGKFDFNLKVEVRPECGKIK